MKTTLFCYFALLIALIGFTACDEGQQMMKPVVTPVVAQDPTAPPQALTPIAQERIAPTQASTPMFAKEPVALTEEIPRLNFQEAIRQKHITGPYLWLASSAEMFQTIDQITDGDAISNITHRAVSETDIATEGIDAYMDIDTFKWTLATLPGEPNGPYDPARGANNIQELVLAKGLLNNYNVFQPKTIYGLLSIVSDKEYPATLQVGSDDAIKIWLNGEVVHRNSIGRPAIGFQETTQVMIQKGDNLLLVKVADIGGNWALFLGLQQTDIPKIIPPPQTPFPEQPTVGPEASQSLTKRKKLTDAIYTSEKLWNARKNDKRFFGQRRIAKHHDSRFEPVVWSTGFGTSKDSTETAGLYFLIVVHNIEYKNACAWHDEFGVLQTSFKDDPNFSPPVMVQIIDKTTNDIIRYGTEKLDRWVVASGAYDVSDTEDERGVKLPRKETCKTDPSEMINIGVPVIQIPYLSPETWENRFQLAEASMENLKFRFHLEDGSFFDYDLKELFPNPPVIGMRVKKNFGFVNSAVIEFVNSAVN